MKRIKLKVATALIFALIVCLLFGYLRARNHIWLSVNYRNVSINDRSISFSGDYFVFKSLGEDIFCYNQDHGKQYLISPKKKEVNVISEEEDVNNYADIFLYTRNDLANLNNPQTKTILLNPKLITGNNFVEFNGFYNEHWRISY